MNGVVKEQNFSTSTSLKDASFDIAIMCHSAYNGFSENCTALDLVIHASMFAKKTIIIRRDGDELYNKLQAVGFVATKQDWSSDVNLPSNAEDMEAISRVL